MTMAETLIRSFFYKKHLIRKFNKKPTTSTKSNLLESKRIFIFHGQNLKGMTWTSKYFNSETEQNHHNFCILNSRLRKPHVVHSDSNEIQRPGKVRKYVSNDCWRSKRENGET